MSSQPVTAEPAAAPAVTALPPAGRARATVLAVILAIGAVASAITVLWQPWGERDHLGYADLAPVRDAAWTGGLIDGLGIAAIGLALGLAVCLLAPGRGSVWATVGAVLSGLGGVAFCAGMMSFTTLAWYATATDAIPAESGTALMTYVENNAGHAMGMQMFGFLAFTLGTLALMVALWRARSVPRWLPIAFLVLTISLFALGGVVLNVAQAAQLLLTTVVAWCLLRAARRSS